MRNLLLLILLAIVSGASLVRGSEFRQNRAGGGDDKVNGTDSRDGKFFSIFTIVRFPNDACRANTGDNGTCLTSSECSSSSGTSSGTCAQGFGVCCVFTMTCGSTTNRNCTYFTNPGYSSTTTGALNCQLRVNKCSNNICQLRLDFQTFDIAQPTTGSMTVANTCDEDQFIATGGSSGSIGPICGYNTGQHVYLDSGRDSGPCTLTMVNSATAGLTRTWKIKVSQIECCSELLAPSGCLQYHTGISGTIYSFNFNAPATTGQHLANQCYGICIRMEDGFCSIQYSQNANTNSFTISSADAATAHSSDANCLEDYVIIPKGTTPASIADTAENTYDRWCGNLLGFEAGTTAETVTSNMKPFILNFVTDNLEGVPADETQPQKGFCLDYAQQPCTP